MPVTALPAQVLQEVFSYLDNRSHLRLQRTVKALQSVGNSGSAWPPAVTFTADFTPARLRQLSSLRCSRITLQGSGALSLAFVRGMAHSLEVLDARQFGVPSQNLGNLEGLLKLREIGLFEFDDKDLKVLGSIAKQLPSLTLLRGRHSFTAAAALAALKSGLQFASISLMHTLPGSTEAQAKLEALSQYPHLRCLELPRGFGPFLGALAALPALTHLKLDSKTWDEAHARGLAALTRLQSLYAIASEMRRQDCTALVKTAASLPALRSFALRPDWANGVECAAVAAMPQLTSLTVFQASGSGGRWNDPELALLFASPAPLQFLQLGEVKVSSDCLEPLRRLREEGAQGCARTLRRLVLGPRLHERALATAKALGLEVESQGESVDAMRCECLRFYDAPAATLRRSMAWPA